MTSHQPARLPRPVRAVCETFLSLLDEQLPGLVEGLYPHGSLGFGEWYDGRRDVDFVAVSSRRANERELRRLEGLHEHRRVRRPMAAAAHRGVVLPRHR